MPYQDPEQAKAYRHEYYLKNRNKIKARVKVYRHDNVEACRERSRAHYYDNAEQYKANVKEWQASHPEQTKKYKRTWNTNNKERRAEYAQEHDFPYHKILEEAGRKRVCEFCGATENVHTHHKDLNHDNNELNNLQWLCGSCHSKLHNQLRKGR